MQVTLKARTPLTENVQKYKETFGHLPSMEAMKHLTPENLDEVARKAVEDNQPIPEWRDRAITKTGTRMDDLYQQTSTKKRQTVADFWQEQRDNGLTQSQLVDRMNSLPPIVTIKSQTPKRKK
jgi:hypothetical protein